MRSTIADARFGIRVFAGSASKNLPAEIPRLAIVTMYVALPATSGLRAYLTRDGGGTTQILGAGRTSGSSWFARSTSDGGTQDTLLTAAPSPPQVVVATRIPGILRADAAGATTSRTIAIPIDAANRVALQTGVLYVEVWVGAAHDAAVRASRIAALSQYL